MSIPTFKANIKRKEMDSVLECLVANSLHGNHYIKESEDFLNYRFKTAETVLFRGITGVIQTLFLSLSLPQGAKVALSPLTPIYYLQVLDSLKLTPLFIDIEEGHCIPSLEAILEKSEEADALILFGNCGSQWNFSDWISLPIPVIEDVSENYYSCINHIPSGRVGDYIVLNMDNHSFINGGGAASLSIRDGQISSNFKDLISNSPKDIFASNFNGSLILPQLKGGQKDDEILIKIYNLFKESILKGSHKSFQYIEGEDVKIIPPAMPIALKGNRKSIQLYALKKGVETHQAFSDSCFERLNPELINCPKAEDLVLKSILFPLYPLMSRKEVELVAKVIATIP